VAPKVYIACGVSGAIQHTAGMSGSNLVVAINTDRNAPIFRLAAVGAVMDLRLLLPALIERLQKDRGSN
jgi:electron transfer flavoprotein alpha subunit